MQWEYKTVMLDKTPEENDLVLNQLGSEGWQMNFVTPESEYRHAIAYMQRPVTNGARQASLKERLIQVKS